MTILKTTCLFYRYAAKVPYGFKPHSYYKGATSTQSFPDPHSEGSTPGRAGIDYPTYSVIPQTSFSCKTQRYKGFFGDPDTSCQVIFSAFYYFVFVKAIKIIQNIRGILYYFEYYLRFDKIILLLKGI